MSLDTVKFFTSTLYFSSECNFHLFLCWSSSNILLSSDWILGLVLSYAGCTYETKYWAWPPPIQFEHMGSIGPHKHDRPNNKIFNKIPIKKQKIKTPNYSALQLFFFFGKKLCNLFSTHFIKIIYNFIFLI